uniref:NME/NM23 nucleoside diphosphate kinase 6 n=1 Tax=Podarcis muralis TaxID=64176 RepID=A0A670JH70_PODMU
MRAVLHAPRRVLQLTLAIIKPDAVAHPLFLEGVSSTRGWWSSWPVFVLSVPEFSSQLCHFSTVHQLGLPLTNKSQRGLLHLDNSVGGPMRAYILAHEEAIPLWRSLMGPTRVFRAQHTDPESIRGSFGLTDTRNTVHGSDSAASASREIAFFFPDFNEEQWYQQEEPQLREREVGRDTKAIPHHVPRDGWAEAD